VNLVKYFKLGDDVADLEYATELSACFDLRAWLHDGTDINAFTPWGDPWGPKIKNGELWIAHDERVLVSTGIIFDIPFGYSIRLHPRSGLALKKGLTLANCEGIIDADYVEPVFVAMTNHSQRSVSIKSGDRICQAELVQNKGCFFSVLDKRPERKTSRAGGFGSTGTK